MMKKSQYELIIYWDKTDNLFVVDVPELPGCMAHGSSKKSAISNAESAIKLWIVTAREDGLQIPEPRGRLMFASSVVWGSEKSLYPWRKWDLSIIPDRCTPKQENLFSTWCRWAVPALLPTSGW
jgi:predicted RNase H-like HicB family nuclease